MRTRTFIRAAIAAAIGTTRALVEVAKLSAQFVEVQREAATATWQEPRATMAAWCGTLPVPPPGGTIGAIVQGSTLGYEWTEWIDWNHHRREWCTAHSDGIEAIVGDADRFCVVCDHMAGRSPRTGAS